jgi:uncharacterized membrane protein (UPF0127 family)
MGCHGARVGLKLPLLFAALMLLAAPASAACTPDHVEFRWPGGKARFAVELADSPEERNRGLMFRESMPKSAGMLFVYETPRRASFWMKNTLIPLDMIFADAAGRVTHVHAMAKPKDTTSIPGGDGVQFVVEINGGLAARLGIKPEAELRHPAINQAGAAWPCAE